MRRFFLVLLAALALTGASESKPCVDVLKDYEQSMEEKGAMGSAAGQGDGWIRFEYEDAKRGLTHAIVFAVLPPGPAHPEWTLGGQCTADTGEMLFHSTTIIPKPKA